MENRKERIKNKIFNKFGLELQLIDVETVNRKTYITFYNPVCEGLTCRKRLDKLMDKKDADALIRSFMQSNNQLESIKLTEKTENTDISNIENIDLNDIVNNTEKSKETIKETINKWDKLREKLNNLNEYAKKHFSNDFQMEIIFENLSVDAILNMTPDNGFKKKCTY